MDKLELKLRESQHQEEENNASILRSIYDKVTQTPWWAKAIILLLLINVCSTGVHLWRKYENRIFSKAQISFWKAAALASQGETDKMNIALNEMATAPAFKNKQKLRDRYTDIAENEFPEMFYDAYMARVLLVETPGGIDSLNRALNAASKNPEAWKLFLDSQNDENTAIKADIKTTIR
jgi:hypothetical protein|tara:strand:- start:3965 stop:4501 length:537 start_codon:yes stop_codon:yes gene_type:complete